jgi:hypothetical protein
VGLQRGYHLQNTSIKAGSSTRKILLIVRTGDRSFHPDWLSGAGSERRNWDLHLSYFGDKPSPDVTQNADVSITREKGPKFPGLIKCLGKIEARLPQYDYIGFPDDDLYARCETWNEFTNVILKHRPVLAQPALDRQSFFSFPQLLQDPRYLLRWTNFVETMTPFFSRDALPIARQYFAENASGWGIDLIWSDLLGAGDHKICIVDAAPVLHTREFRTGPNYKVIAKSGAPDPLDDLRSIKKRYNLSMPVYRTYGGVTRAGSATEISETKPPVDALVKWRQRLRVRWRITELNPHRGWRERVETVPLLLSREVERQRTGPRTPYA